MIRRGLVKNTRRAKMLEKMSDSWILEQWRKHSEPDVDPKSV